MPAEVVISVLQKNNLSFIAKMIATINSWHQYYKHDIG